MSVINGNTAYTPHSGWRDTYQMHYYWLTAPLAYTLFGRVQWCLWCGRSTILSSGLRLSAPCCHRCRLLVDFTPILFPPVLPGENYLWNFCFQRRTWFHCIQHFLFLSFSFKKMLKITLHTSNSCDSFWSAFSLPSIQIQNILLGRS